MGLDRLAIDEHHGNADDFPQEFLDMTIGDVLNKMSAIDTPEDAEYEVLEAALIAMKPIMLADARGMERDGDELDLPSEERNEMPSFIDMIGSDEEEDEQLDFKF
tara:strand:+ start:2126 stop:2440 length:315 start_codon:yes stop_codon:yes gene_type:complete